MELKSHLPDYDADPSLFKFPLSRKSISVAYIVSFSAHGLLRRSSDTSMVAPQREASPVKKASHSKSIARLRN